MLQPYRFLQSTQRKKGKLAFRHEISYHQHEDKGLWGELVQVHIEDVNSPIWDSTISNEQVVENKFFTPRNFISLATCTTSTLSWILGKSLLKPKRAHIHTKRRQNPWFNLMAHDLIFWPMIQARESYQGNFGSCDLEGQEVCSVKLQWFKVDKEKHVAWHVFPNSLKSNEFVRNR